MHESESEVMTLAAPARIGTAPSAPLTLGRRLAVTGDFLSRAVAVAFFTALGAVTALATVVIVTVLAPLFLALFVRALRQHDRRLPAARFAA